MEIIVVSMRPGMLEMTVVAKEVTAFEAAATPFSAHGNRRVSQGVGKPLGEGVKPVGQIVAYVLKGLLKDGNVVLHPAHKPIDLVIYFRACKGDKPKDENKNKQHEEGGPKHPRRMGVL